MYFHGEPHAPPMRAFLLTLAACLVASGAAMAQQDDGRTRFTLLAELVDGEYVWVRDGVTNPTLRVTPHSSATVHIQQGEASSTAPHTIQVGGGEASEQVSAPGEAASVTFTAPPSGSLQYLCTIHPSTMRGTIEIGDVEESSDNGVPMPGAALVAAFVGLAALAWGRRRR